MSGGPVPRTTTFAAAVAGSRRYGARAVLLGNGFSMDYDQEIFGYESLAKEARLDGLSVPQAELFAELSSNFEAVIENLGRLAKINDLYGGDSALTERLREDRKVVRRGLAAVIAERHPSSSSDLSDDEVRHARTFLSNFSQIFTLNYDLLLYWVAMRADIGPTVVQRDGFEFPSNTDRSKLVWKLSPWVGKQQIFYLHGALHYFHEKLSPASKGRSLTKVGSPGRRILASVQQRINLSQIPLVVTEGRREEKEAHIERSRYLRTSLRRFGELEGAVFLHGLSLSNNDGHILERLEANDSRVEAIYVGLHKPGTRTARRVMDRADEMAMMRRRNGGAQLRVRFYDAATARVWRD